jgi:hypothetical protein
MTAQKLRLGPRWRRRSRTVRLQGSCSLADWPATAGAVTDNSSSGRLLTTRFRGTKVHLATPRRARRLNSQVVRPQALEIRIDPNRNDGSDVLCIYTGVFDLRTAAKGTGGEWARGNVTARIPTPGSRWTTENSLNRGPGWTAFVEGTVVVSLASIIDDGAANYAGWAVDEALVRATVPTANQPDDHLQVAALVALRDTDGYLRRIAYQVTAKVVRDERTIGPEGGAISS